MTRVFLSYDRDDATKARSIADILEKGGHEVWWDRHIRGGSQYSKEIEQALANAEAVVVLWSRSSVDSAWVRDEAAAGRDSGRLVPVLIDGVQAPLGFRQYQAIDLSRWKGRGKASEQAELVNAVRTLGGQAAVAPARAQDERRSSSRLPTAMVVGLLAALVVAIGLWLWTPWDRGPGVPVVAVAPASSTPEAEGLAADLLTQLGSLQAADADALQLVDRGSSSKPDLTFKIAGSAGAEPSASLSLVDSSDGALLWSRDFKPPSAKIADLRQQVAYTAARVLECATEGLSAELKQQTLKLYLAGCAVLHSLWEDDPRDLIQYFKKVTEQAPEFAGGWEKRLLAELEVVQNPNDQTPADSETLRRSIVRARQINPDMAEAYLAEAWLQNPRPIITWMKLAEKAVERNPNNAIALVERARGYQHVGRMRDAIADTKRAVQIDPLSPGARDALATSFTYAGQIETGFKVLEEAERLWPGASNLLAARYRFHLRYGDPKEAMEILKSGAMTAPAAPMQESFLEARIARTPAAIDRAIAHARGLYVQYPYSLPHYMQTLAEFDRHETLAQTLLQSDPTQAPGIIEILFRPAFRKLWADERFMPIAQRYGLIDYWRESGIWPDFCIEPALPYNCQAEAAKVQAPKKGRS